MPKRTSFAPICPFWAARFSLWITCQDGHWRLRLRTVCLDYWARRMPKPSVDRTVIVPTDGGPDMIPPKVLKGAAAIEQDGAYILITTKSADRFRDNQIKAIGSARKKQRRA